MRSISTTAGRARCRLLVNPGGVLVSLFGVTEFLYVAKEQIERSLMGFEIMAIVCRAWLRSS